MNKAIFLDRDGVINVEKNYAYKIEEFEFISGVFDALKAFSALGYTLVIVTNQSGIARGYYTHEDFDRLTAWMVDQFACEGVKVAKVYCCPHGPDDNCTCRKPKPGMFLQAQQDLDIDMVHSWMIGDKQTDIDAAQTAGITQTILVESGHDLDENATAKYRVNSIFDTIGIISKG
jgi:D-glycero-D-manno-heptose 1,7-bisphosphate phosphatase